MIYDISTIAQKELKEILVQRGSLRSGLTNIMITLGIIGILFPLQWGVEWVRSPIGLVSVIWLPLFMAMGVIANSFAGERERNTLETLLASRLSDQAILFGKMTSAVTYSVTLGLLGLLLGAATVNMQFPGAGFYPPALFLGALGFSLLASLLISGLGVLISLRAENVRQAYQRMSLGFLVLWLPLILGPQFLPESAKAQVNAWLMGLNLSQLLIGFTVLIVAADLILIGLAMSRFKRSRLMAE